MTAFTKIKSLGVEAALFEVRGDDWT